MKLSLLDVTVFCLSFIVADVHSQNRFYVTGEIQDIADGESLAFFRYRDGSLDMAGISNVLNGKFTLTDTATRPTRYWILGTGKNFPDLPLEIWAAPDITITIKGKGYLLKTWKVKSSLQEQLEENKFLAAGIEDWNEIQRMQIEQKRLRARLQSAVGIEKDSLQNVLEVLNGQMNFVNKNIERTLVGLLEELPVTVSWLNKFEALASGLRLDSNAFTRNRIINLYKRLTSKQRKSDIGEKITANLFPLPIVKPGQQMVDMALSDTQMVTHNLTDYTGKGKSLLLEFGFVNCAPCILAIPETKKLADLLKDQLTIISINIDEFEYWITSPSTKEISWVNLNDKKGSAGLAARYGATGYPYYVLISPEGIVKAVWTGYEKGDLTKKIRQYLDDPKSLD